jgi:glycosyltransferase involved in cell wall biosynthesis
MAEGDARAVSDISVIMPTLASRERATMLVRAIDSVLAQDGVRGVPLVVVNGGVADPQLLAELRHRRDITLVELAEANLPAALRAGRCRVQTDYFSVLDDDDVLLPGALATRRACLQAVPEAGVVVTNGYLAGAGSRRLNIEDFGPIEADPLHGLLDRHWLPPCAGFFRTSAVTADFFDGIPRYREWTYLALRLALALPIVFVPRPTFVYTTDTPDSLSKSPAYSLAGPPAIARMLQLPLPADVRARLRVRMAGDMHSASSHELEHGHYRAAWAWHWRSLTQPSGWRYLPFARHLLRRSLSDLLGGTRRRDGASP